MCTRRYQCSQPPGPRTRTGPSDGSSSKAGWDSIRSVGRSFRKLRKQQRRRQQRRRLPPRHDVRLRHDKHRRDRRLRDERQRGQRRRAHRRRDRRRHQLKSWQCTRYRRIMDAVNEKIVRRDMIALLSFHDCRKSVFLWSPDWTILEQVAPGSRNLTPSVMPCVIASLI